MTQSLHEQALARVAAILADATSAGTNIFRGRVDALSKDELPGINIRRMPSNETAFGSNSQRSAATFDMELDVDERDDWETAVDALWMEAHALIVADEQLATLGRGLRCTGTETIGDGADRVIGKLTAHYEIQLLTNPGDISRSIL